MKILCVACGASRTVATTHRPPACSTCGYRGWTFEENARAKRPCHTWFTATSTTRRRSERAYRRQLEFGPEQAWPPPTGYWRSDGRFALTDGRTRYVAALVSSWSSCLRPGSCRPRGVA